MLTPDFCKVYCDWCSFTCWYRLICTYLYFVCTQSYIEGQSVSLKWKLWMHWPALWMETLVPHSTAYRWLWSLAWPLQGFNQGVRLGQMVEFLSWSPLRMWRKACSSLMCSMTGKVSLRDSTIICVPGKLQASLYSWHNVYIFLKMKTKLFMFLQNFIFQT